MHRNRDKAGPSGMSRNDAFSLPESWGGRDCLLPIEVGPIRELKKAMGGEEILQFVSSDYAERADAAYNGLGIAKLTFDNVWAVFKDLFHEMY